MSSGCTEGRNIGHRGRAEVYEAVSSVRYGRLRKLRQDRQEGGWSEVGGREW